MVGVGALESGRGVLMVGPQSGLQAQYSVASDSLDGPGVGANGDCFVDVNYSTIENNPDGGLFCGASFCSAQKAVIRNNTGGEWQELATNVFWDGWIDVTGAVSSGHDYEVGHRATSNPSDSGTIFNANLPAP